MEALHHPTQPVLTEQRVTVSRQQQVDGPKTTTLGSVLTETVVEVAPLVVLVVVSTLTVETLSAVAVDKPSSMVVSVDTLLALRQVAVDSALAQVRAPTDKPGVAQEALEVTLVAQQITVLARAGVVAVVLGLSALLPMLVSLLEHTTAQTIFWVNHLLTLAYTPETLTEKLLSLLLSPRSTALPSTTTEKMPQETSMLSR